MVEDRVGHKGREEGPPSQGLTLHCRLLLQVSQVLPLLLNCPMPCKEAQGKGGSVLAGLHLASTHREGPGPCRWTRTEASPTLVVQGRLTLPPEVKKGAGQLAGGAASSARWGWRALWEKSHETLVARAQGVQGGGQKPLAH